MKAFQILFLASMLTLSIISCKDKVASSDAPIEGASTEEVSRNSKEYTSAYICPMHCEGSGSDTEGVCPACGMDYVANESKGNDSHDHEGHDHEGHDHEHEH